MGAKGKERERELIGFLLCFFYPNDSLAWVLYPPWYACTSHTRPQSILLPLPFFIKFKLLTATTPSSILCSTPFTELLCARTDKLVFIEYWHVEISLFPTAAWKQWAEKENDRATSTISLPLKGHPCNSAEATKPFTSDSVIPSVKWR